MTEEIQKKSPLRRFMPLIIFALLVALLWYGLGLNPLLVPSPLVGKPAPEFELPLLNEAGDAPEALSELLGRCDEAVALQALELAHEAYLRSADERLRAAAQAAAARMERVRDWLERLPAR